MKTKLLSLILLLPMLAWAQDVDQAAKEYFEFKNKVVDDDQSSRKVLSSLYEINKRMKSVSEKRSKLTDKVLNASGNIKILARSVAELETLLQNQKGMLARRLAAMYKMGDQGILRALFSTSNSHELDKTMRYLKIVSERDHALIKEYQANIKVLENRRTKLNGQVKNLLALKEELKKQERVLSSDQTEKSKILSSLQKERERYVVEMKKIRQQSVKNKAWLENADIDFVNGAFFEAKGTLETPISGAVLRPFGLIQDDEYYYRLSHKGLLFKSEKNESVYAVQPGLVAFAGSIPGYGKTIIIDHGDHYYTVYGYNSQIKVRQGDRVKKRDIVAVAGRLPEVGSTGVYFEIRHFSDAIDPTPWFKITNDSKNELARTQF